MKFVRFRGVLACATAVLSASSVFADEMIDFDDSVNPFSGGTISTDQSVSGSNSLFIDTEDNVSFELPAGYEGQELIISMKVFDQGKWINREVSGYPTNVYGPRWGVGRGTDGASYVAATIIEKTFLPSTGYGYHAPTAGDSFLGNGTGRQWFSPAFYSGSGGSRSAYLSATGGTNTGSWAPGGAGTGAWHEWTFTVSASGDVTFNREGLGTVNAGNIGGSANKILLFGGHSGNQAALSGIYIDDVIIIGDEVEVPGGETYDNDFEGADALDDFSGITGTVEVDSTVAHGGSSSLKIEAGSEAHLILSLENQGAVVEMWVYDDMTVPTDPTLRRVGSRWLMEQADGRYFGASLIYAPYVNTDTTYVSTDKSNGGPWYQLQYLTEASRSLGWHKWVYDLDPENGLTLFIDDVEIAAFDWSNTGFEGMVGLAFFGDTVDGDSQTIWVDDISVELKGAMQIRPDGSPAEEEPEGPVPNQDPAYDGPPIDIVPALKDQHPRLLFSAEDLPGMRSYYYGFSAAESSFRVSLDSYASATRGVTPSASFLTNATEGQRYGMWQLPTVAMHYLLADDTGSRDKAIEMLEFLLEQENWEGGGEIDSGMSAGNIMFGAGLAFDWLYDELDPTFRDEFRDKLWLQARRMYYLGHLQGADTTHYWQGDPQNNHRFHRNVGLTMATLAAYTGADEEKWLLSKLKEEMEFVVSWLPTDGSSHEAPSYWVFGLPHLTYATIAVDRNLGLNLFGHPYFKNAGMYRAQTATPGLKGAFGYGDSGGLASYNNPVFSAVWRHQQSDLYAMTERLRFLNSSAFAYPWMVYATYPGSSNIPALGDRNKVPTKVRFPDIEVAFMREDWSDSSAAAMFKCGPFGGYSLNEFRDENNFTYVNVAHDDPDANSFVIWKDGGFVAKTDSYSYSKKSANHNTILVDGIGQEVPGRSEGGQWSQPTTSSESMKDMAYITAFADLGDITVVEGEAANSYKKSTLTRYRRGFIWNEGKYVLIIDDLRAGESEDYTWLLESDAVNVLNAGENRYQLEADGRTLDLQLVSNVAFSAVVGDSPADNRNTVLGLKQLQASASGTSVQFASVYDVWDNGGLSVELNLTDADHATITVTGSGFVDTWTWTAAADATTAASYSMTSTDNQSLASIEDQAYDYMEGLSYRVGGWMHTDWFGWAHTDAFPWVYSTRHGWVYCGGTGGNSTYFWIPEMGWMYTNSSAYPWMYSYTDSRWMYYHSGVLSDQLFGYWDSGSQWVWVRPFMPE